MRDAPILLALAVALGPAQPSAAQAAQGQRQPEAIETKVRRLLADVDRARLERTVRDLAGFGTRHVASAPATDAAALRGTAAARDYLEARLRECASASEGRLKVARQVTTVASARLGRDVEIVNLVATLPGVAEPERAYVVGGHYDSINGNVRDAVGDAPGANDDASGTAVVLEACRVMAAGEFAATLHFVCYDAEEMGLLGSAAHARELRAADARIDGMVTNDIVGNTLGMDGQRRTDYLRCFSYSARGNDSPGRSLARAATFAAARHLDGFELRLVLRGDRYGRGGDHRPFDLEGYPAVRFTEAREDYSRQHRDVTERDGKAYGDVPDFVDFAYLARVCQLNVATLAELASAPAPPRQVRVRAARDAYDTVVWFTPVTGAAGYEVVHRLTTAADWEHRLPCDPAALEQRESGQSMTLKGVCLDDVVVGVCSVGPDGSRSRVATPADPDAVNQRPERRGR
jgi:hypothetical protein